MPQTILQLLSRLWNHLSRRRRSQFGLLLVLMVFASFAEVISIGAVLPFLAMLTDPARVFAHPNAQLFIETLELKKPEQLLLPLTILFAASALIAGAMRLLLLWATTRLSFAAGADLSINIYRRTLYQPYMVHLSRNSSEVINGISGKASHAISVINMALNFISSGVMLVSIMFVLLAIEPKTAILALSGFGSIYILIIRLTRKRLLINSQISAHESTYVIKSLQEGLGGIRDILIDGSQATYCQIYSNADLPLRRAQGNSSFISSSPRSGVEALGMLLIAALAYSLAKQSDDLGRSIPILGALALGAQRLLPALQQAYGAWSGIQGGYVSLKDTLELLDQPLPSYVDQPEGPAIPFLKNINLKQIYFRYGSQSPWVIHNLNLTICKGSRIGFIGETGSGKSTLLDIVMGLLEPSKGSIEVDGQSINSSNCRAWQKHIAHVPQTIYLSDGTIEENIAFGIPIHQINQDRVKYAARQAQIASVIETWPKQYKTMVGERGIRLSGGQRQRIGIARALYKQADVIIFDEATSALDSDTEHAVMQAIEGLSKELTLLIIAHRITTLKKCTQIIELSQGEIKRKCNYSVINNEFPIC